MRKRNIHNKTRSSEEVIPALLSPTRSLYQKKKSTSPQKQNIIDIIETKLQNQNQTIPNDRAIRERLHDAIAENHIDLFMQPVVSLPQRHTKFYEFFGRLRISSGVYLPAYDYMTLADQENMVPEHDRIFLIHCLKVLKKQHRRLKEPPSYFINIKPATLRHSNFMQNLLNFLSERKDIAHALIFEMPYADFLLLSPAEKKIIDGLAQIGCRFSIDHVNDIPTDVDSLCAMNICFVKVKAETIIAEGKTEEGFSALLTKKRMLDVYGIDMVIEKTEKESELKEILDYDVKYAQGFLFGRPDFQGVYTTYQI